MSCSKQEIERKRLEALQRRQNKLSSTSSPSQRPPSNGYTQKITESETNSKIGPIKSVNNVLTPYHPYSRQSASQVPSSPNKVVNGTVYLISEERFEVNPSEFCTPLINVFKTISSRNYDHNTKLWNFNIEDYKELMSKVAPLAPDIVLGPLPQHVLKLMQEPQLDLNSIDISPIEYTLRKKLMPFQQEGVRFGISRRGRCMIADDMGLGKTYQALAIASYYRHNWPLLIVTTSSMRETWQSTIHELLPSVPIVNIVTLGGQKDVQQAADRHTEVLIVSYKLTTTHAPLLRDKKFGVVIIDESHNLKSHKAQCTVALTAISRGASRVLLLSGTPALSRPAELFTQLSIIDPTYFKGGYTEYGKRYCAGKMTNFGWDMSGQSNLTELQLVLQKKFLIRRTKEQVLTKLHDKVRESVMLDHTLLQFTTDDQMDLSQMAQNYTNTKTDKHAALITFFSESARVKAPAICKYLKQLIDSSSVEKFLVFAHHRCVIDAVCDTLDELAVSYVCIVGATPSATRADLVDKFQASSTCRCAVLSTTAANAGITLTAASLVLFAELHWNPGILTQAESRAHRIGQRGEVRVRYLLARGTSDDYMWPMLQDKLNVLNEVGLSKDSFEGAAFTIQESRNNITQYLSHKNPNDYIPGTNIKKSATNQTKVTIDNSVNHRLLDTSDHRESDDVDLEKSFMEHTEDDELLANLDL